MVIAGNIATGTVVHGDRASEISLSNQTLSSRIQPNWYRGQLNGKLEHEGLGLLRPLLRLAFEVGKGRWVEGMNIVVSTIRGFKD